MGDQRRRGVLSVVVDTVAGPLTVPVPSHIALADPDAPTGVGASVGLVVGGDVVRGVVVASPAARDAAILPVTGSQVAALPAPVLRLIAEAWIAETQRARRTARASTADPERLVALARALGQARVLRAVAGDVVHGRPTAGDFNAATEAGLLVAHRLDRPTPALEAETDPLAQQAALAQRVEERVAQLGPATGWRSRSAFAGITTAAALVLTGCGTNSQSGDRRCTDTSGQVVDDSNCRSYGGGGGGFYFFRYGGSTFTGPGGGTFLRGGSTAPKGGSGFFGRSGGGG